MSTNWAEDIFDMHDHYGVHEKIMSEFVYANELTRFKKLLEFRIRFLEEELNELKNAEGPEDVVDALVDLCVVAIGTLDVFGVDAHVAWDEVLKANMAKQPGIKPSRPNPLGLPDLIKPEGWVAPSHDGNYGFLPVAFLKFEDVETNDA